MVGRVTPCAPVSVQPKRRARSDAPYRLTRSGLNCLASLRLGVLALNSDSSDFPRCTISHGEQPVGFFVIDELLALRIPLQRALQLQRQPAQQHGAGRAMRGFDVTDGPLTRADAVEKISGVAIAVIEPEDRSDRGGVPGSRWNSR